MDVNLNLTGVNITNVSYVFFGNNSIDTYLYRSGTNTLQTASHLVVAGGWINGTSLNLSSGFILTPAGSVGIGTTSPQNTLNVIGDINATGTIYSAGGTSANVSGLGAAGYIPQWATASSLNNSNIYQLGSNVGIGTASPQQKLDVVGGINSTVNVTTANLNATNWVNSTNLYAGALFANGTKVGVGTVNPNYTFTVSAANPASILITSTDADASANLRLYAPASNANQRNWIISSFRTAQGDFEIAESDAKYGDPYTAGTTRLYISQAGKVGIGANVWFPSTTLEVAGTINATTNYVGGNVKLNSTTSTYNGLTYFADSSGGFYTWDGTSLTSLLGKFGQPDTRLWVATDNANIAFRNYADNTNLMVIANGGNVGIGTGAVSPSHKLTVVGSGSFVNFTSTASGLGVYFTNLQAGGKTWILGDNVDALGVFTIQESGSSAGAGFHINASSNNIGIGTAAPGNYKLNVIGDINASWGNFTTLNVSSGLTVLSSGSVGIGTISPTYTLTVNGSIGQIPKSPLLAGGVDLSTVSVSAVFVSGRYAYVGLYAAATNEFRVVDVSNPSNPVQVGVFGTDVGEVDGIRVVDRYAYIIDSGNKFRIIDVSNASSPTQVSSTSVSARPLAIDVAGKYAYIGVGSGGATNLFEIWDVSNPASPSQVSSLSISSDAYVGAIRVAGKYAYIGTTSSATSTEFRVIDISNPANPTQLGAYEINAHVQSTNSIDVRGGYAYIATSNSTADFLVLNITNPISPLYAGSLDLAGAQEVYVGGGYAFVGGTGAADFQIVNISNPASPSLVASLNLPATLFKMHVSGRYAYAGLSDTTNEFVVIDTGGVDISSMTAGSIETGYLEVTGRAIIGSNLQAQSITAGENGIFSHGPVSLTNNTLVTTKAGSVGIGTASPVKTLDVVGTINATGDIFARGVNLTANTGNITGTLTAGYIPQVASSSSLNNSNIYQLGSNVGIGTTAPVQKLDVVGVGNFTQGINSSGDIYAGGRIRGTAGEGFTLSSAAMTFQEATTLSIGNGGILQFANGNNRIEMSGTVMNFMADGVNRFLVQGETDPIVDVMIRTMSGVSGEVRHFRVDTRTVNFAEGTSLSTFRKVSIGQDTFAGAAGGNPENITDATTLYIAGAPVTGTNMAIANPYALWVDAGTTRLDGDLNVSANALYVNSTSNSVGIGTASPQQKLDVVGVGNFTQGVNSSGDIIFSKASAIKTATGNLTLSPSADIVTSKNIVTTSQVPISSIFSSAGNSLRITLTHTDNTSINSDSFIGLTTGGTAGGDAFISMTNGVTSWSAGMNNEDPNTPYVISATGSGHLGTGLILSIMPSGNVGIGTASPVKTLDVVGTINATGDIFARGVNLTANTGNITGTLTAGYIPQVASSSSLNNSNIYQLGSNVGIGTTSPNNKLEVVGNMNISGNLGINGATPASTVGIQTGTISANGVLVHIQTAGNLSQTGSGTKDTSGGVYSYPSFNVPSDVTLTNAFAFGAASSSMLKSGTGTITNAYGVFIADAPTIGTNNYALYVGSGNTILGATSGNVGIGTASPNELLHLQSSASAKPILKIENTNADADHPRLNFVKNSSSPAANDELGAIRFYGNDSAGATGTNYATILTLSTDVTDASEDSRMSFYTYAAGTEVQTLVLDSGEVGIGDATPEATLEIVNSSTSADLLMLSSQAGTDGDRFIVKNSGNVGIGTASPVKTLDVVGTINATGDIFARGVNLTANTGNITGTLTAGYIPQVASSSSLNNSNIYQLGSNVGIGTTSPQQKLDVVGVGNFTQGINSTGNIIVSGTNRIGIGIAPPTAKLHVRDGNIMYDDGGGASVQMGKDGSSYGIFGATDQATGDTALATLVLSASNDNLSNSARVKIQGTGGGYGITLDGGGYDTGGDITMSTWTGTPSSIAHTVRLTVKAASGNVGIGTATPLYALQISNISMGLNVSNLLFVNNTAVGIGTSTLGNYKLNVIGDVNASWANVTNLNVTNMASTTNLNVSGNISQNIFPGSNGLVGYWKFSENFGTKTRDDSGYGNTGTLTSMSAIGSPTSGWNANGCRFGNCLAFDSVNDYVNVGNDASLKVSSFTISLWVNDSWATNEGLMGTPDGNNYGFKIYATALNGQYNFLIGNGSTFDAFAGPQLNSYRNQWTHVVVVWNASNYTAWIYVNGVLQSSHDSSSTISGTAPSWSTFTGLNLGLAASGTYFLNGTMDDVRLYNRTLTAGEISALYQAGDLRMDASNLNTFNNVTADTLYASSGLTVSSGVVRIGISNPSNYRLNVNGDINATWGNFTTLNVSSGLTVLSSGNVGIGTASPTSKLHVSGSTTAQNNALLNVSNGTAGSVLFVNGTSGNIGIGNTTAPSQLLHLSKDSGDAAILIQTRTITSSLSKGPNSPSTVVNDSGVGTIAWSDPGNAIASDDSNATAVLTADATSYYLKATGFGFSIPSGATIKGIVVEWERGGSTTTLLDNSIKIVKGGTITGTEQADPINLWPKPTQAYKTYGTATDLWGATWTSSDINSADFGAALSVFVSGGGAIAYVDHVRITVYYAPTWTLGTDASENGTFKIAGSDTLGSNDLLTINNSGFVGIGTASPTTKLDVNGTLNVTSASACSYINAGSTSFTACSSRDIKENITQFTVNNILDKIAAVPVNTYDFKDCASDSCRNKLGLVAEDFYAVLNRGNGKSVDGQDIQMAMWLGMQELIKENNNLKTENSQLKSSLDSLESRITALESKISLK